MKKRIFNNRIAVFLLSAMFALTSCSSTKVVTDKNTTYDFNEMETYAVVYDFDNLSNGTEVNNLNKKRIEKSLMEQMEFRGLELDEENPDVIINFYTRIESEQNIYTNGSAFGTGYGRWGYRGMNVSGSTSSSVSTSTNGFIIVEMYDSNLDEIVWYSLGEKNINEKTVSTKADKEINNAIDKMMEDFPLQKQIIAKN